MRCVICSACGRSRTERLRDGPLFSCGLKGTWIEPRALRAPSPRRGEGWGEGARAKREKFSMASTVQIARRLRRHQTDAERILWFRLRDRRLGGWKFRRQMSVNGFVVDFCCPDARL